MKTKVLANSYLSSFCLELSMLIKSGIWPADALLMLRDDETDRDGKAVIERLLNGTREGKSLSQTFNESGYFPEYMVNMIDLGERTGHMTETLEALSEHYGRQDRLSVSLRNALMYPSLLFIMMVAAVLILVIQVLPIFNDVFGMMGSQMSPLANQLMMFGKWLSGASAAIAVAVCAVGLAVFTVLASPGLRESVYRRIKKAWGGRGLFAKVASLRFTSAMALAVKSGLAIEDAVELASMVSGGARAVDEKNEICMAMLKSGKTVSEAMAGAGILSARDSRLLAVGSRSGRTDDAIAEIAERNDINVRDDISRLVGRIEPALVVVTSVIVGVVLFSVMLPLIGIMTSLN